MIQARVEAVGPERFGIVSVDCAKARSKWMLADFYGSVIVESQDVEHNKNSFQIAIIQLREAIEKRKLKDVIVAVEMTGIYHKPPMRAFRKAGFETRLVHPFASSYYRQPEHGDIKTDENDLVAIFRAAVNGFGLLEKPMDEIHQRLQIVARQRRDLVKKKSKLQCQIRHHLERGLPGFAALFNGDDLWTQATPVPLLKAIGSRGGSVKVVRDAGVKSTAEWMKSAGVRFHQKTIDRVAVWSANAADSDPHAVFFAPVWMSLLDDWERKKARISQCERDMASLLVKTPYVLLLSHPGINVVSASELAGEMGPIENYASATSISGRAGLFPSRYQSDEVDRSGKLTRFRNAKLRAAFMVIADNMLKCNAWWMKKAEVWKAIGVKSQDAHARVANRMTRVVFQIVSGRKLFCHPSRLDRGYVLDKLLTFYREQKIAPAVIVRDLKHASDMMNPADAKSEAVKLQEAALRARRSRQKGPQELGNLLVGLLAQLGITADDEVSQTVT